MQKTENPLKFSFRVIVFILVLDLLRVCVKLVRLDNFSEMLSLSLTWVVIHQIVAFGSFAIFIYFYMRKSLMAWYVLMVTLFLVLPALFLIGVPRTLKPLSPKALILMSLFWVVACSYLFFKYKPYKNFIEGVLNDE